MDTFNKLNEVFDIDSNVSLPKLSVEPLVTDDQDDDFQLARNTLKNLIQKNEDVIQELIYISKNSEHPRAFEVVGQLIKAQAEIAKDLVGVHKTNKDLKDKDSSQKGSTTNNIVFAGSTSDLLKLISSTRAKTIDSK